MHKIAEEVDALVQSYHEFEMHLSSKAKHAESAETSKHRAILTLDIEDILTDFRARLADLKVTYREQCEE